MRKRVISIFIFVIAATVFLTFYVKTRLSAQQLITAALYVYNNVQRDPDTNSIISAGNIAQPINSFNAVSTIAVAADTDYRIYLDGLSANYETFSLIEQRLFPTAAENNGPEEAVGYKIPNSKYKTFPLFSLVKQKIFSILAQSDYEAVNPLPGEVITTLEYKTPGTIAQISGTFNIAENDYELWKIWVEQGGGFVKSNPIYFYIVNPSVAQNPQDRTNQYGLAFNPASVQTDQGQGVPATLSVYWNKIYCKDNLKSIKNLNMNPAPEQDKIQGLPAGAISMPGYQPALDYTLSVRPHPNDIYYKAQLTGSILSDPVTLLVKGFQSKKQCDDKIDNDGDNKIDYPADPGCTDKDDDDETDSISSNPQCSDTIDNDGDGKIDMADPGCSDPSDNDERDAAQQYRFQCFFGFCYECGAGQLPPSCTIRDNQVCKDQIGSYCTIQIKE